MTRKRSPLLRPLLLASLALVAATGGALRAANEPVAVSSPSAAETKTAPAAPALPRGLVPAKPADEIRGLLNLGASLTDRNDFDAAEIAYRQVLNADDVPPADTKTALLGLAHMHRKQGSLIKAVAIYEKFLALYPGDERTPDALIDLGRTLRDMGVYRLAIARFYSVINSTLNLPPEGFDHYQLLAKTAQFEIAETNFVAGNYAEAAKFYSRLSLLDLAPGDRARAQFKAACSQQLQGDLENAVGSLRGFLAAWPDDENVPEARYLIAVSLRSLNRPQEAFAATLELLRTEKSRVESDPKRWIYWQRRTGNQLANDFFEAGDTLNAHAIYACLVALSPELSWRLPATYQMALCYERLGMNDRAQAAYQSILDAAGATPPADIAELTRMAAWRLNHLDWRNRIGQQITAFFNTTTGQHAAMPIAAKTSSLP
jgi:tetratricopeptide (TPR) repeat protein